MGTFIDLTGIFSSGMNGVMWDTKCDCGNDKQTRTSALNSGKVNSCGCLGAENRSKGNSHRTHGKSTDPIFYLHTQMTQRCKNKNNERYEKRGISVCDRWLSFENFYKDMGDPPEGMTLERKGNDGDYSPENVIWASKKTQARNRTTSKILEFCGEKKTLAEWSDIVKINYSTLMSRLSLYHWSVDKTLSTPVTR